MFKLNQVPFVSVGMEIISKVHLIKSLSSNAANNNVYYERVVYILAAEYPGTINNLSTHFLCLSYY